MQSPALTQVIKTIVLLLGRKQMDKDQTNNTLVTIITVCFNAESCIERTMRSVLKQTYKNIEYIVKDGESKRLYEYAR